jgi:hypothetical protein
MNWPVIFAIVFLYTAILWVVVLILYSVFIESFDFGRLSTFALKSVLIVGIVAAVATFVPYGGLLNLLVWALGLLIIFRKDMWELRVLVLLLWGVNFAAGLLLRGILQSMNEGRAG